MAYDVVIGRDKEDRKKYGMQGLIYIGKGYIKMGNYTSLSNRLWLDVVRSHVILIAGKRGSGKCLDGDTLINLGDGSSAPIKDLENNKENVLSINNNLKMEKAEKSEFFSREVNKMLKIKLRSGKEIKLTHEHPLLTIKGWQEAQNLKIGSRIATPRKSFFGENSLPENEVKLLAYLIAEGHTKKIVLFSNSDNNIVEDFKESLYQFDSSLELIREQENNYRISKPDFKVKILNHDLNRDEKGQFEKGRKGNLVEKRSIREFIENYGLYGKLAIEKEISQKILKLRKEQLAMFLNRLFSCDGSIYKSNDYWQISYSSSSEKLIKQVQSLLLKFGILSKLRKKKIKYKGDYVISYELVLNSENVIKFIDEIGFFGKKEERVILAKSEIMTKTKNPNIDTIPKEIWETYSPKSWTTIGKKIGYKHPKAMRERIKYAPSRNTLLQIAKADEHRGLKLLANSDIFWDEIVSIELLEGKFIVYDICVPENHNFVANDIIVHNSYSIGVLAEEMSRLPPEVRENLAPLIFDTMGIFWTMKYRNDKDLEMLQEWDLKGEGLNVNVWVPSGHYEEYEKRKIPVDKRFALAVSELAIEDWLSIFELKMIDPVSVVIQKIILRLSEEGNFDLDDIIEEIKEDSDATEETKKSAVALFEAAKSWKVFAGKHEKATTIQELVVAGRTSVLDLSVYSSVASFNVRALIIGLVSKKLFNQRMLARKKEEIDDINHGLDRTTEKKEMPLVWMFLDEAHEFLPVKDKTPATNSLVQLLREGRQPGISMVLATQQPGVINRDVMTQSDIVMAHRLTNRNDVDALNEIMQTYLLATIQKEMRELPELKGSAIILDDNSERLYPIRIRPRLTWHGGEAPKAITVTEKEIKI